MSVRRVLSALTNNYFPIQKHTSALKKFHARAKISFFVHTTLTLFIFETYKHARA